MASPKTRAAPTSATARRSPRTITPRSSASATACSVSSTVTTSGCSRAAVPRLGRSCSSDSRSHRHSPVELYPAIDIRSGRVVRLSQGEATRQTVYGDDPIAVAERFVDQGARWIHLVDLDRAFGTGDNFSVVARVAERVGARVRLQIGGGFRSLELVQSGLDLAVARVVIGTAAALDPDFVPRAISTVGAARLAVGIDARDGNVAVR